MVAAKQRKWTKELLLAMTVDQAVAELTALSPGKFNVGWMENGWERYDPKGAPMQEVLVMPVLLRAIEVLAVAKMKDMGVVCERH